MSKRKSDEEEGDFTSEFLKIVTDVQDATDSEALHKAVQGDIKIRAGERGRKNGGETGRLGHKLNAIIKKLQGHTETLKGYVVKDCPKEVKTFKAKKISAKPEEMQFVSAAKGLKRRVTKMIPYYEQFQQYASDRDKKQFGLIVQAFRNVILPHPLHEGGEGYIKLSDRVRFVDTFDELIDKYEVAVGDANMFAQQRNEAMTIEEIAEQRVRDALEGLKDRSAEGVSTKKARSDSSVDGVDMDVDDDWDDWSNDFTSFEVDNEATKAFFTGKDFGDYVKTLREDVDEMKSCILVSVEYFLWEAVRILPEGFKGEGLSRLRGVNGDPLSDELKVRK